MLFCVVLCCYCSLSFSAIHFSSPTFHLLPFLRRAPTSGVHCHPRRSCPVTLGSKEWFLELFFCLIWNPFTGRDGEISFTINKKKKTKKKRKKKQKKTKKKKKKRKKIHFSLFGIDSPCSCTPVLGCIPSRMPSLFFPREVTSRGFFLSFRGKEFV